MNGSKTKEPRNWDKWRSSGAVEGVLEAELRGCKTFDEWAELQDRVAPTKTEGYLEQSRGLVKADLLDEWNAYVVDNTDTGYNAAVVGASITIMQALSEGKTIEEARKETNGTGLSGYMAGQAVQMASYYRGE